MTSPHCDEDLGGFTLRQLLALQPTAGPEAPVWLVDGSAILVKSTDDEGPAIRRVDLASGAVTTLANDLGALPFLGASLFSVSPNGRWLAYLGDKGPADARDRSSRVEIWLRPVAGGEAIRLTHLDANINAYQWAPDGSAVVLSANRFGRYDIYKVAAPGGETVRLTSDPLYEVCPVFSGDGEQIYFVRLDEKWTDHTVIGMTSSGTDQRVIAQDQDFFDYQYGRRFGHPLVSQATGRLLFPSHRSGWINYWQTPIDSGEAQPLHAEAADQSEASLSPDGRRVAFVANHNGATRLVVKTLGAGRDEAARVLVAPAMGVVAAPAWSPDGSQIAYLLGTPTCPSDLWVVDVSSGEGRQLTFSPAARALQDKLVAPQKITYAGHDGLEIAAYLYAPPERAAGQRHPGLLYIHGGPTSQFMDDYRADVQYYVRKGYVVLLPNIRGSSGYGKQFEDANNRDWGHGDLGDVLAGVDFLRTLDYVDGENMGIHGTSYGGCMSMSAVGFAPGAFKAAVPHAGYGDWLAFDGEQELRHRQLLRYEFGDVASHREIYERCSPIHHLAHATTPVFLVHGAGRFPRSDASLHFARALEQAYKSYEYKVYPNECYYVRSPQNLCVMIPDIVDFLDRYLK